MRATVHCIIDDVVTKVVIEGEGLTSKIHPDGRGYVRTTKTHHIFRNVQQIAVELEVDER